MEQCVAYLQLIGSLVHDANALRGLLGEPTRVVSTELWNDGLCLRTTLAFPSDVHADLRWIFLPEHMTYSEEIGFVADAGRVRLRFPSPFLHNTPSLVVREGTEAGVRFTRDDVVSYEDAFLLELAHLHHCVGGGRQPETSAEDGRADLAVLRDIALAYRPGNRS
jgi:predicted dehydrogenase